MTISFNNYLIQLQFFVNATYLQVIICLLAVSKSEIRRSLEYKNNIFVTGS